MTEELFDHPVRAWLYNNDWTVLVAKITADSDVPFRNYAIPMKLQNIPNVSDGGHSIVSATKSATAEFGEFEHMNVLFQDNSELVVEFHADNLLNLINVFWDYYRSDGVEAHGSFRDDKSYEALARAITGAQAENTQVDRN